MLKRARVEKGKWLHTQHWYHIELSWVPNLPFLPVWPRQSFLNLHKLQSPHLKPENNNIVLFHSLAPSTTPTKLLLFSTLSLLAFSHETSWKIVFGLYLSLVFYLQLNILWKHLASVNNCLFGNYSSSSCTLLAMMRQLWKERKAFSMVGASRKTGWMGQGVYLEQREAAWWKGWWGNGNGEGEPQTSHREVLIPASSSIHTRPRKQEWRVWTEKWQLGIFLEGSLIADGVSSSRPIYILCSICYY